MPQPQTVDLTPSALRELGKLLNAAADRLVAALNAPAAPSGQPERCPLIHGDPYIIYPPEGPKVGFIDDRGQVRYVEASRAAEVPAGWRPLLLAPAVKR